MDLNFHHEEALRVATLDTAVGLLAGLITFPVVMSFGLKDVISESTVGTLFIALPTGFANLGLLGRLIAAVFFGLAFIAGRVMVLIIRMTFFIQWKNVSNSV